MALTDSVELTHSDWVEIHMALTERVQRLHNIVKKSPTPEYWEPKWKSAKGALDRFEKARFSAL